MNTETRQGPPGQTATQGTNTGKKPPNGVTNTKPKETNSAEDKAKKEKAEKDAAKAKEKADKEAKRAADKAKREADATARKEERARLKAEKEAARPKRETPAHMSKIDKQAQQLPALDEDGQALMLMASNASTRTLNIFFGHLDILIRKRGVVGGAGKAFDPDTLKDGDRVKIVSGKQAKFIGQLGVITKKQRIRTYVAMDSKPSAYKNPKIPGDYFFTTDLRPENWDEGTSTNVHAAVARLTTPSQGLSYGTIEDEGDAVVSQGKQGKQGKVRSA